MSEGGLKLVFKLSKTQNGAIEVAKREPLIIRLPRLMIVQEVAKLEALGSLAFESDESDFDADGFATPRSTKKRKIGDAFGDGLDTPSAKRIKDEFDATPKGFQPYKKVLNGLVKNLIKEDIKGFFYNPVNPDEAPGYYDAITRPMNFITMREKIMKGKYPFLNAFEADFDLICTNAMAYNPSNSIYHKEAKKLQAKGHALIAATKMKVAPEHWEGPLPEEDDTIAREITAAAASKAAAAAAALAAPAGVTTRHAAVKDLELLRPKPIDIKLPKREYVDMSTVPPPVPLVKNPAAVAGPLGSPSIAKPAGYQPFQTPGKPGVAKATGATPKTPATPSTNYLSYTRGVAGELPPAVPKQAPIEAYEIRTFKARDSYSTTMTLESYQKRVTAFVREMPEQIKQRVAQMVEEVKSGLPLVKKPLVPAPKGTPEIDPIVAQQVAKAKVSTPLGVSVAEITAAQSRLKLELGGSLDLSFLDKLLKAASSGDAVSTLKSAQEAINKAAAKIVQVADPSLDAMLVDQIGIDVAGALVHFPPSDVLDGAALVQARTALVM